MAKGKNRDADELFPTTEGGAWSAAHERSSKYTTRDLARFEEQEDNLINEMNDINVTKEDKNSIADFQKKLFGDDGSGGMIKTGNKGISRKKLYEEMMTTLELNGIKRTHHVDQVVKQSILAILG